MNEREKHAAKRGTEGGKVRKGKRQTDIQNTRAGKLHIRTKHQRPPTESEKGRRRGRREGKESKPVTDRQYLQLAAQSLLRGFKLMSELADLLLQLFDVLRV